VTLQEGAVIDFLERRRVVATKTFVVKMKLVLQREQGMLHWRSLER
jgi:hypothetical protein